MDYQKANEHKVIKRNKEDDGNINHAEEKLEFNWQVLHHNQQKDELQNSNNELELNKACLKWQQKIEWNEIFREQRSKHMQVRLIQRLLKLENQPLFSEEEEEIFGLANVYIDNCTKNYIDLVEINDFDFSLYEKSFKYRSGVFYINMGTVEVGQQIGEQSLKGGHFYDRLIASSDEDVLLMSIEARTFNKIANKIIKERAVNKSIFLQSIPGFSKMNYS